MIAIIGIRKKDNKKDVKVDNSQIQTVVPIRKENDEYVVYNNKGKEITRISEDEKYKAKIYEIDSGYQEIEREDSIIGLEIE